MNSRPQNVVLLISLLGAGILLAIGFSFVDIMAKQNGSYAKKWLDTGELFSSGTPVAQGKLTPAAQSISKKQDSVLGESTASASMSASAKVSPSPTTSPSVLASSSPLPSVSPSPSPLPLNVEKACFDFSSEFSYNSDTYFYGKPLILDASCSENGKSFRWSLDKTPFSASGQSVTVYPSGKPIEALQEKEITLSMTGKSGATTTTTKKIKLKSVPEVVGCFTPTNKPINFAEEVNFSGSCTYTSAENTISRYFWKFRDGDRETQIVKEGKDVSHIFSKFSKSLRSAGCESSYQRGFEVEFCVETRLGGTSCSIQNYCPSISDPKVQQLKSCMLSDKTIEVCLKDLNL